MTDQNQEHPDPSIPQEPNNDQIENFTDVDSPDNDTNQPMDLADFVCQIPDQGGRVCITYGRDQIMNRQVVSLIKELGIQPIVMQDKDNARKPLAQFITEHKDIAFLIAILSADDWVYPKNGKPQEALLYADQRVVFHLGFWIGKLGRNRVFVLYYDQRSFRWPTGHFDVIYTPLDRNDAWKTELTARLKQFNILAREEHFD